MVMDLVKDQGYRLFDALIYVSLSLPRFAYQLFPIATLIGALVGAAIAAVGLACPNCPATAVALSSAPHAATVIEPAVTDQKQPSQSPGSQPGIQPVPQPVPQPPSTFPTR